MLTCPILNPYLSGPWSWTECNNDHVTTSMFIYLLFKSSKTHTSAAPLLLEKGAEVKMKLQDLKLLIDKKH